MPYFIKKFKFVSSRDSRLSIENYTPSNQIYWGVFFYRSDRHILHITDSFTYLTARSLMNTYRRSHYGAVVGQLVTDGYFEVGSDRYKCL
jgi:hypothetical protein